MKARLASSRAGLRLSIENLVYSKFLKFLNKCLASPLPVRRFRINPGHSLAKFKSFCTIFGLYQ